MADPVDRDLPHPSVPEGAPPPGDPHERPPRRRAPPPRKEERRAAPHARAARSSPSPAPAPAPVPPAAARAPGIFRGLVRWVEEHLRAELPEGSELPERIEITLRLPVPLRRRGYRRAEREFAAALANQLDAIADHLRTDQLGFRAGHVFCPWCASPICEHSLPPDPRSIFVGHAPTGVPLWRGLGSWLLECGDERLDRLYRDRPIPLARPIPGSALTADLLPEFGDAMRPLSLVGAVVAGYFAIPRPRGGEQAIAVTALVYERRSAAGQPRYTLNPVVNLPPPHHLPTLLAERIDPVLSDWVAHLRHGIAGVEEAIRAMGAAGASPPLGECRARVLRALEDGADYLEKRLRRRAGRTDHAEERSADPERPTASALSDVVASRDEDLFHDRREGTLIVRGPRNRVHVFRGDGTHITSIQYPAESIRDRIAAGRWQPLEPARAAALRTAVKERRRIEGEGSVAGNS